MRDLAMMINNGAALKGAWQLFVSEGDEPAYHQLYAHYHRYFTYIGVKRGALATKIADCIHDLFLYVFENRVKLSHVTDHHNYLVSIFIRSLFKKAHFTSDEGDDIDALMDVPVIPAFEQDFMTTDTNTQIGTILNAYIDQLSSSQAQIVYEKFYLGLTYHEIAVSHNITVRTAYNTIFQALGKLRKQIGENKLASLIALISILSIIFYIFSK